MRVFCVPGTATAGNNWGTMRSLRHRALSAIGVSSSLTLLPDADATGPHAAERVGPGRERPGTALAEQAPAELEPARAHPTR